MKRLQRILAAVIALLLILTSLTAISVFAESEEGQNEESTSSVEEVSSSSSAEESSSSAEEKSSSSDEKSSSSAEEKSSSSSKEESSSEESEPEDSEQEKREERPSSSSSSSEEEVYAQTITHDVTGITIGLSQPNDKLLIDARSISSADAEYSAIYKKLLDASKDKELVCCYEVMLGGDESFNSKVTVILPVDASLIGRSMVVLFYPERASHVETSNKNVAKAVVSSPSADDESEDGYDDLSGSGVIKVSETLESGRKYYFAVCEFADFVPASNGFGLLEIMAILIGVAALASGGLLALLWVRYNKKQQPKK